MYPSTEKTLANEGFDASPKFTFIQTKLRKAHR